MEINLQRSMAAVNWFCLVLAFAFIKIYVCIKVDPNEVPNGNYTTINLSSHAAQPYAKSIIISNETDNFTLLGNTELSASERTRRLIPYMAFYMPVSQLPINKQYVSKTNTLAAKQLARPSSTGGGVAPTGTYVPIPPHYGHGAAQYLQPAPPAALSTSGQQHYHPNAGLGIYHTHGYGGQQQQPQLQTQPLQQLHLLPPTTGHAQHLQPPGPPGPSAAAVSSLLGHGKGNGNNHNSYKEFNPLRQKTVQYFPPLTSTVSTAPFAPSASTFETIRQTSSITKQQANVHNHGVSGSSGNSNIGATAAVGYRSRTKQSKINITPFTPSNTVPGYFVPIVYTPVNNNNNNNNNNLIYNNNILNSHNAEEVGIDDGSFNQNGNQQYHKQQQLQQHHYQQPQQIGIEYSSGPLPPSGSAEQVPLQVPQHHHHHQQQQQQTYHQHNPQQQSHYSSVTTSPSHVEGAGDSVNSAHRQHHNAEAFSSPTIYHQNQHHQQQLQPEHKIVDVSLRTSQQPQMVTVIGSQQQQQQQQQLLRGGNSAIHFQPPKPESFFESDIQVQQHEQHNIEQVLKDVNSYSIKNSQMLTPQEKYVMYLQQRLRYNKHPQRQYATRHKYREHNNNNNNNEKELEHQPYVEQHQQNPTQNFVLSSTMSPPTHDANSALAPIRPSQPPLQYNSNFPQHSHIQHDLYSRPNLNPTEGGGRNGGDEAEEQILTIPVHSLFSELETFQQQKHNHFSQSHSASKHKSHYSKNGPAKPQYIDYLIHEPKQSLDDEQQQRNPQQHLEVLKPTLGPPTHAFILVTTAAPYQEQPVTQTNYGSSLGSQYESKTKIRLQPVAKEKNVNYVTIREQNPRERPHVASITPKSHQYNEDDGKTKYVYIKEEFGQKLSKVQGDGTVKLKPLNKYESDDNKIPQQHHHQYQQQQQQQQPDDLPLQPLTHKLPTSQYHHNEVQTNAPPFTPPKTILADPNELPDIRTSSLAEILHKLQESNHLPHTLTPDNIDNSIKTLIRILNNLKQTQTIVANPPQHHEIPAHSHPSSPDYDYTTGSEEDQQQQQPHDLSLVTPTGPNKHPGPSTGRAGIDYPNYADIPQTSFDCSQQRYKGFFGDPDTNCQVWHYCDLNGGKASFLCPNGTIFSQIALTCDWWFNVKCATTPQLYVLNERLYKYILPFTPKFPEDYSGPIVDKYLAMKFQEMEEKMRLDKEKALREEAETVSATDQPAKTLSEDSKEDNNLEETTTANNDANGHVQFHPAAKQEKHESVNSQVSEQSSERNLLIDDEVDDISQRGSVDNYESTTIATRVATKNPDIISFSLKPIIVSSTLGPEYNDDDDHLQGHENEKRSQEKPLDDTETKKTASEQSLEDEANKGVNTEKTILAAPTITSENQMQITVEKVDVIEIKPDGATGHLIRDMSWDSKQTN